MPYITDGHRSSRIMIVGEAPGVNEARDGKPFIGASGQELDRMLHEAGILRSECFLTNVCHTRPSDNDIEHYYVKNTPASRIAGPEMAAGIDQLRKDISDIKPELIISLGDTPLWALTDKRGITKWRGSQIYDNTLGCKILPTYHPAAILRNWSWRFITVQDLKRAGGWLDNHSWKPDYDFRIRPSYYEAIALLNSLEKDADASPITLSGDIETRGGHIACFGIAWTKLEALCIPFMDITSSEGYWSLEEELAIVLKLRRLFRHPNIRWIFQNGIYDFQYFARYWRILPTLWMDTMLAHHVCFAGLPKGLDFLSSLYCDYHLYWKDEGKEWDKSVGEDQLWTYNCKDCVTTFEAAAAIDTTLTQMNLQQQFQDQMRTFHTVLHMMLRGVRCDLAYKAQLITDVDEAIGKLEDWINVAVGHPLNLQSPKQMAGFFYGELGLGIVKHKKSKKPTCDKTALEKFVLWQPLLKPLTTRIEAARSGGAIAATFIKMKLDIHDKRIRCSYNVAGTETYRLSSSQNAFGSGGNLQNVPRPHDPDDPKDALAWLPPVRNLFIPDPDCVIIDIDLKKADVFIVAAEAHDAELLEILNTPGANLHLENAKAIFGNERLTKASREYTLAKNGVHAVDYGSKARTLAITLGTTIREAEHFIARWFSAHPGIPEWHRQVESALATTRRVSNRFGYTRYYFDRIESILPEALAWVPQSTVGLVTNKGLNALDDLGWTQPLLQTHDSVTIQVHQRNYNKQRLEEIEKAMLVPIPYDTPLTIPVDIKASHLSWGDCEEIKFGDYGK